MKKLSRVLAIVMALVMVMSLAACSKGGSTNDGSKQQSSDGNKTDNNKKDDKKDDKGGDAAATYNYNITVWVPEKAVELTVKQIADFNASNTDGITLNATVEAVSEADSATQMITDVEAGADIFFFAQDQTARLIEAGALSKLGQKAAESVSAANAAGVVAACVSGEDMYCYPLTADNGYFMYYDKSVIPESDIDDMTKLIADCEKAGRNFCFELDTSAWYLASFFFGTGCVSEWASDLTSVNDTFNSDKGLIAAKGIRELIMSPNHYSSSQGSEFDAAVPAAIVISGTWDYDTVANILGDNLGVADMPSFTVDGTSYHLGSFNGCKLLGVKPQTDAAKSACLHKLAQYLVSEQGQMERFEALSWGPANTVDQADPKVQANPGLAALLQQAPYSLPQCQIHGSWWDIGKVIATDIKESDGSDEGLKAALQKYEDTISALFNMTSDEKEAWSVIGLNGDWNTDLPMTQTAETGTPTFYSNEAYFFNAGSTFKVRQGASWDVNFGDPNSGDKDGNCVVGEEGYYFVKLVYDKAAGTGVVTLEKSSFYSWSVIGSIAGDGWTIDIPMEIQADGTTFKVSGIALKAGEEFKVRKAHGWTENFGADGVADGGNIIVEADGTFDIVFDSTTGMVTVQ